MKSWEQVLADDASSSTPIVEMPNGETYQLDNRTGLVTDLLDGTVYRSIDEYIDAKIKAGRIKVGKVDTGDSSGVS